MGSNKINYPNRIVHSLKFYKSRHATIASLARAIDEDKNHEKYHINNIVVQNCQLDENDYQSLNKILTLSDGLKKISFESNKIDIDHAKQILNALAKDRLTSLKFSDNWIGEEHALEFMTSLAKNVYIKNLDLSLDWLGNRGIYLLFEVLQNNKSLKSLNLSCNDFYSEGLKAIINFLRNHPKITHIDLSYNRINENHASLISEIISNPNLTHIDMRSNNISQAAEYIINALPNNKNLQFLNIADNSIDSNLLNKMIAQLDHYQSAVTINASYNKINPAEQEYFKQLVAQKPHIHLTM